jgi:hypothetical protein
MKSFSKFSSVIIVAAVAAVFTSVLSADDIIVKPLRYQPPAKSQFVTKAPVAPAITCPACENKLVPTVTQDAKLKTKTILVAKHGCEQCKTTIVRTGAQKATGKDVVKHTCGALIAAVETCCAGMK